MADVMTQADIDRKAHLDRLPEAVAAAAAPLEAAVEAGQEAVKARDDQDRRHGPEFVNPTAMQRIGFAIRLGIYPANLLAEMTAGAASATYLARTLLRVSEERVWLAPYAFAAGVLAIEMGVAHMREHGRDEMRRAPLGWTVVATAILLALVGLQVTTQLVDAIRPVVPGDPILGVSAVPWYTWARIAFFCMILATLHVAVLFGGNAQEASLAYANFRIRRRVAGARIAWHALRQRRAVRAFSTLVTRYENFRTDHTARGFDPGSVPVFDDTTRAMLSRLRDQGGSSGNQVPPPEPTRPVPAEERESDEADGATAPPVPRARPTQPEPTSDAGGLADENAYLRSVLDARMRTDDGEVRAPAR